MGRSIPRHHVLLKEHGDIQLKKPELHHKEFCEIMKLYDDAVSIQLERSMS